MVFFKLGFGIQYDMKSACRVLIHLRIN